jgi:hypothetical protein
LAMAAAKLHILPLSTSTLNFIALTQQIVESEVSKL